MLPSKSNDENVIISAMFDKCPYFDHISSGDHMLYFGLYDIVTIYRSLLVRNKDALHDPSALGCLIEAISETGEF